MSKKTLLSIVAILSVFAGVVACSAFEAHVINVTAHIENALLISPQEIDFGTVFPQEYVESNLTIQLSDSFLSEGRVDDVEYIINQKTKPTSALIEYFAGNVDEARAWCHDKEPGALVPDSGEVGCYLSLCPFLSKLPEDEPEDVGELSYYDEDTNTCPPREPVVAHGRLSKTAKDTSDIWTIDLKVPPIKGFVGQDWPIGCPVVPEDSKDYGCDLWIEVTGISEIPQCIPSEEVCDGIDNDCDGEIDEICPAIVKDNFNIYANGSIIGQGDWSEYKNGDNFVVQGITVFEGAKALYNNSVGDSVIGKAGTPLADGRQAVYVRSENRSNWGFNLDGNAQVRVSKGLWASGAPGLSFAAVSFKKDGNVAYYDPVSDVYQNFDTYNDNEWTLLEIEWRSSDKTARYRVNNGLWTGWHVFANSASFTNFDYLGLSFALRGGSGGVYFDTLY